MRPATLLLLVAVGCKGKEHGDTGSIDTSVDSGTDSTTDSDTGSDSDTDTGTDSDTSEDTDTGGDTSADTGGDTGTVDCYVDWADGSCYDTTVCDLPSSAGDDSLDFLNQCSDVDYAVFDNATRIPSSTWTPGTDLPPV